MLDEIVRSNDIALVQEKLGKLYQVEVLEPKDWEDLHINGLKVRITNPESSRSLEIRSALLFDPSLEPFMVQEILQQLDSPQLKLELT